MYYVGYSMVVVYCWFEFLVVDGVQDCMVQIVVVGVVVLYDVGIGYLVVCIYVEVGYYVVFYVVVQSVVWIGWFGIVGQWVCIVVVYCWGCFVLLCGVGWGCLVWGWCGCGYWGFGGR